MTDAPLFEQARIYLPKYLSPAQQRDLWEELKAFPRTQSFYSMNPALAGKTLQGDGWRGFVVIDFTTLEKKTVSGVVVSNSCDIDVENARALPTNVLFAPLMNLQRYAGLLEKAGQTEEQRRSTLDAIREQKVTSIFYLPAYGTVLSESIVLLHDIHQHPLKDFVANDERSSLFKLSQTTFYLFLLKLSIHFTRAQEGIAR